MKDSKLNNLLSMKDLSEKDLNVDSKGTKRTDVAKDVLKENAYVVGKEIFNGEKKVEIPTGKGETVKVVGKEVLGDHLKNKETHAAKGLNNLVSLDDFKKSVPQTKDTPTKRTGTAKDVLQEKNEVVYKTLNNLISLDDFTEKELIQNAPKTKRTDVAKDVLKEGISGNDIFAGKEKSKSKPKAKAKDKEDKEDKEDKDDDCDDDCCEDCGKEKCECKKGEKGDKDKKVKKFNDKDDDDKDEEKDEDDDKDNGLTPGQKKLPESLQKAILARKNKK
jgi:hypothetical protein